MKKLMSLVLSVVMVLGVMTVGVNAEELNIKSIYETGTYKVSYAADYDMYESGCLFVYDEQGEVKVGVSAIEDFVYSYVYIDENKDFNIDMFNVSLEKVSDKDLGVSGHHVWFGFEDSVSARDPLYDDMDAPVIVDLSELSSEEIEFIFS